MSVIDFYSPARARLRWKKLMRVPRRILVLLRRNARRGRLSLDLSRLDERLLYDLGVDPLALHDAVTAQPVRRGLDGLPVRPARSGGG